MNRHIIHLTCPGCKGGNIDTSGREIQQDHFGRDSYRESAHCRDCGKDWELEKSEVDQSCRECRRLMVGAKD